MLAAWGLIGISVGLLLGVTGAGGAIVAVPLFMHLAGTGFREATVLSLLSVLVGAALNWFLQRANTRYFAAFLLVLASPIGSHFADAFKDEAPDWVIRLAFILVCAASLASLWVRRLPSSEKADRTSHDSVRTIAGFGMRAFAGGALLGVIVTLTGLGGGVVLVPLLHGALGLPMNQATATSLLTITLSALSSVWIQRDLIEKHFDWGHVATLAAGSVISALAAMRIVEKLPSDRLNLLRRWLISAVILASIATLLASG